MIVNTLHVQERPCKHTDQVHKGVNDNDKHLLELSIDNQEWENLVRNMYNIKDGQAVSCLCDTPHHLSSISSAYGLKSKSGQFPKIKFNFKQSKIRDKVRSNFITSISNVGSLNQYETKNVMKSDQDREYSVLAIAANRPIIHEKRLIQTEDSNWFHDNDTFP